MNVIFIIHTKDGLKSRNAILDAEEFENIHALHYVSRDEGWRMKFICPCGMIPTTERKGRIGTSSPAPVAAHME